MTWAISGLTTGPDQHPILTPIYDTEHEANTALARMRDKCEISRTHSVVYQLPDEENCA